MPLHVVVSNMIGHGGVRQRAARDTRSRSPRSLPGATPVHRGGIRQRSGLLARASLPAQTQAIQVPVGSLGFAGAMSWRAYVAKVYLSNKLSSPQVHQMVSKAEGAGAQGTTDIGRAGACGRAPNNLSRDMARCVMRGLDFPMPYMAYIPVSNLDSGLNKVSQEFPFLLPHWKGKHSRYG